MVPRVSGVVRTTEIAGLSIDRHRTGNETVIVLTIDFDSDIRSLRADLLFRLRPHGNTRPLFRLKAEAVGHGVEKFGDGLRIDNVGTAEKRGKGAQGPIGSMLLTGIFAKSRKQGDRVDYGAAVGDIGYVLESLKQFPVGKLGREYVEDGRLVIVKPTRYEIRSREEKVEPGK